MTQPMNPEPEPEPTDPQPPSRRTAILVGVAAVLAIVVVIGIVLVATSGDDEPASTASSSSTSSVVTQTVTETPSTTEAPTTTDETTEETTTTTTTDDTGSSTPSTSGGSNPGGLVIYDCGGQAEVRPSNVTSIYCGDNSVSVRDITWSRWGPRTAVGTGTEAINLCRPNCAAGNFEQRPVDVELSAPRRKGFTTITITGSDGVTQSYELTGNAPN